MLLISLVLCTISVSVACVRVLFFFFFKQKTAYEMRISDWSSDVCSSDLAPNSRAAFRNDLNLISRLHSTSGFGVRPARYSARKWVKTSSQYSDRKSGV